MENEKHFSFIFEKLQTNKHDYRKKCIRWPDLDMHMSSLINFIVNRKEKYVFELWNWDNDHWILSALHAEIIFYFLSQKKEISRRISILYNDTTGRKMRFFFLPKLLIVKNNTLLSKLLQLIKSLLGSHQKKKKNLC